MQTPDIATLRSAPPDDNLINSNHPHSSNLLQIPLNSCQKEGGSEALGI